MSLSPSDIRTVAPAVVAKSTFLLVDVREAASFEHGHLEGAINMPKQANKWPTLKSGLRSAAQSSMIVVIDDGVYGNGEEVADLIIRILKKHCGVAVLLGGMRAYCDHKPELPLVGKVETFPDAVLLPRIQRELYFTEDESPLEDDRVTEISEMVNEAFSATIHDLPKELKYDYTLLGREVKRLRLHGQAKIEDTGVRYRIFCAYERGTLVGTLVLKHSKFGARDRWAVVKYVCGLRKGVGFQLQRKAWEFCRSTLELSTIHAGAWLEFPHAWSSHLRWGYHFCPFKDWPRGANSTYGHGVVGMRKNLLTAEEDAKLHHI